MNHRIPLVFLLGALAGAGATRLFREEPDKGGGESKPPAPGSKQMATGAGRGESPGKRSGGAVTGEDDFLKGAAFQDFGPAGPTVEDFREVMCRLPGMQRSMAFSNLMAQLTPATAPDVLKFVLENARKYDLHREHEMLWERWGEIDGQVACAAIFEDNKRFEQTKISQRTIEGWARRDPSAAYSWLMAQEDVPLRASMVRGVIDGWAATDPEGAHRFLTTELKDASMKNHGYWCVARSHLNAGGLPAVESYFAGFDKNDPDYNGVRITVADTFIDTSSADALRWMNRLDTAAQAEVSGYITERLVRERPDDLIRTLASDNTATGFDRPEVIGSAVKSWIGANPNAMGEWLNAMDANDFDLALRLITADPAAIDPVDIVPPPLQCCIYGDDPEWLEWLLDHGANIEHREQDYGSTPLICAIVHRNKRIIRTLVQRGADATRAMACAQRGLAGAYEDDPSLDREGYREIVELLRELGIGSHQ